jgi:transposase InsO family protein
MVFLTHVRSAFTLSSGTYGRPRTTRKLQDSGQAAGRHRAARLMRERGLRAWQKGGFKRTIDSHHTSSVAPNLLDQDVPAQKRD